jgi:hypothetical protein
MHCVLTLSYECLLFLREMILRWLRIGEEIEYRLGKPKESAGQASTDSILCGLP